MTSGIGEKMGEKPVIAVIGTFDSKGDEHFFLKERIEQRGLIALTINIGAKSPSPFAADIDLYQEIIQDRKKPNALSRDEAIQSLLGEAITLVKELYSKRKIHGIISAGGGTGTYLGTSVMKALPLGVPKVMISTVASRDMSQIVGTKDITMMHSVVDLLGLNSISGSVLDRGAGAVCGMTENRWRPDREKKRIALTMFGFITEAAEEIKACLEDIGYEVIAFHANGTGGMAMEELAAEGHFHAILDLATHELADDLMGGYCGGIGPERLDPLPGRNIPRLVVPGGLDCAVLEFTRSNIPEKYRNRKIFFYDFRSGIRLNEEETLFLAGQLAEKLNKDPSTVSVLVPTGGWSEADRKGGPLYDPVMNEKFVRKLKENLSIAVEIREIDLHINDPAFAKAASTLMDQMIQARTQAKSSKRLQNI
jgi:uncharacterized protein (UPF0261 family)